MKKEATEFVQKCRSCQVHANVPRQPPVALTSLQGAWPFVQWGIDLLGPLPLASCQRKFIIMKIDYFTKWVEAEPPKRMRNNSSGRTSCAASAYRQSSSLTTTPNSPESPLPSCARN
ncbi:hypothetical protein KSP39_PZI016366 [Platanthera zijinensis]|uniref:Integrase n=1 Tax=Platanthera zijinensis TaxID=2320716 RepID=A0AAP0G0P7_9ASPA